MISINQGMLVLLVLLDLSAVFYTDDINVPFTGLKDVFNMSDRVLVRFRSYQEQRPHGVSFHDIYLTLSAIPQGTCLAPLVFTM